MHEEVLIFCSVHPLCCRRGGGDVVRRGLLNLVRAGLVAVLLCTGICQDLSFATLEAEMPCDYGNLPNLVLDGPGN